MVEQELRWIVLYACGHFGDGTHNEGGLYASNVICGPCGGIGHDSKLAKAWREEAESDG